MKNIFNMNSLNKKLLGLFLTITIIPLTITALTIYYAMEQGFSKLAISEQVEMEHTVQTQFDKVSEQLLAITKRYAMDPELIDVFESEDQDSFLQHVSRLYPRLQVEHNMDVFEFGNSKGVVLLRGHNPEKQGDDKSGLPAIQSALDGDAISGFEFGTSGLSVRAFAPIIYNNEVIGTLQTSVDDTFLKELSDMLQDVTIDLYDQDGNIVVSSNEAKIGGAIENESILSAIQNGETLSRTYEENLVSYIPMYDPTRSEIIGTIGIHQDLSVIQATKQQIIYIVLLLASVTIIVVMLVSILFSRKLSKPIQMIAGAMGELAQGNLSIAINSSTRKDEIGQLTNAMQRMKDTLHGTIQKVAEASSTVRLRSEELTQSANEVKSGSEQIAMTMEEIAFGTEKQADGASELADTMGMFDTKVRDTSERGEQVQRASTNVLSMTTKGKQLMDSSAQQMMKIDEIVLEAVEKMANLNNQTQEISKLVSVIQSIADQTNLLALNASIEAARAGEYGNGFAVVANEVRKLAEQVSRSVTDITEIVTDIRFESNEVTTSLQSGYIEVEQGTRHIQTTSVTFNSIDEAVTGMVDTINGIAKNLAELAVNSQVLNHSIEEIASISEESAAGIEETTATSQQSSSSMEEVAAGAEELTHLAEQLHVLVRQFKL